MQSDGDKDEAFAVHFERQIKAIEQVIADLDGMSKDDIRFQAAYDLALQHLSRLQNDLSNVASSLPAYEQRAHAETIKRLSDRLQRPHVARNASSKFSFKPKGGDGATLSNTKPKHQSLDYKPPEQNSVPRRHGDADPTHPSCQANPTTGATPALEIVSRSDELIRVGERSDRPISGVIIDVTFCVVDLNVVASAITPMTVLTVRNVDKSLLICGNVASAAHISNVSDSVVVLAASQIRMHDCRNCQIYVAVSSKPVIERSSNMQFAPLPSYFARSWLEPSKQVQNLWDNVQDFQWLRPEPSPNWRRLDEAEKVEDPAWGAICNRVRESDLMSAFEMAKMASR